MSESDSIDLDLLDLPFCLLPCKQAMNLLLGEAFSDLFRRLIYNPKTAIRTIRALVSNKKVAIVGFTETGRETSLALFDCEFHLVGLHAAFERSALPSWLHQREQEGVVTLRIAILIYPGCRVEGAEHEAPIGMHQNQGSPLVVAALVEDLWCAAVLVHSEQEFSLGQRT